MNSLVRVFSNFKEFYSEINGATLTGAIDVIVVEQPDGEFLCSPFHVRFGKLGVLRSREKIVDIEINGEPVDIHMKLGDSGEAFFVEECPEEEIEELTENLSTSPIPTYELNKYEEKKNYTKICDEIPLPKPRRNSIDTIESPKGKRRRRKKSQIKKKSAQNTPSKNSLNNSTTSLRTEQKQKLNTQKSLDYESSTKICDDVEPETKTNSEDCTDYKEQQQNEDELMTSHRLRDSDILFFSDTEVSTGLSPNCSRPSTPIQSDSELEISQREKVKDDDDILTNSTSWKWGELPQREKEQDIAQVQQRQSMLSGMFSFMKKINKMRKSATTEGIYLSDLETECMNPEMAALYFPSNKSTSLNNLPDEDRESGNGTSLPHSPNSMEESVKSLDSDYDDGKNEKYADFAAISLSEDIKKEDTPTEHELNLHTSKSLLPDVATEDDGSLPSNNAKIIGADNLTTDPIQEAKRGYSWWYWRRSAEDKRGYENIEDKDAHQSNIPIDIPHSDTETMKSIDIVDASKFLIEGDSSMLTEKANEICQNDEDDLKEKYRKTLRLSSEAIKSLDLKPGVNEIEFSVTTAYQGTSRCKCYLFRWKYNDKVIISDIDGTITKSDVLGHILPMVGKDWAQIGVAQLFSKIETNGYKLLYLSARAIGQSRVTREYLRSIRQGDVKLPDGPLLLNPTSLISAFHREVIEKKPEQFKIACLSDIKALFPENPFYAGYGNRINDVWAYRAVGIPIMRIFTINTKGELKHELTQTFQSSYCGMTNIVDQLFPPIKDDEGTIEYSNFNYWRDPVPDIDVKIEASSTSSSAAQVLSA